MSWQACKYARYVLEDDTELTTGARMILMLCAERANRDTGATFGGGWLCRAANLHPANVRKYLHELHESGLIRVCGNRGKALEIRFPIVEALSTPRADTRGVWINDPARSRAQPRAIPRAILVYYRIHTRPTSSRWRSCHALIVIV